MRALDCEGGLRFSSLDGEAVDFREKSSESLGQNSRWRAGQARTSLPKDEQACAPLTWGHQPGWLLEVATAQIYSFFEARPIVSTSKVVPCRRPLTLVLSPMNFKSWSLSPCSL